MIIFVFNFLSCAGGGGTSSNNLNNCDGSGDNQPKWYTLGAGIGHQNFQAVVHALIVDSSDNLYVCGDFTQAGGKYIDNIAKWNGFTWSAVGSGYTGAPHSLASDSSNNLYVTFDDEDQGRGIQKWDGTSWAAPWFDNYHIYGFRGCIVIDSFDNIYMQNSIIEKDDVGNLLFEKEILGPNRWNRIDWEEALCVNKVVAYLSNFLLI